MASRPKVSPEPQSDPIGTLLIRTLALPANANLNGGVFGGWVLAEMDKAAGLLGMQCSCGPCSTAAIEGLSFLKPLKVGEDFRIYGHVVGTGRTSMRLELEGWGAPPYDMAAGHRIVRGLFVSVAVDGTGRPRPLPERRQPV